MFYIICFLHFQLVSLKTGLCVFQTRLTSAPPCKDCQLYEMLSPPAVTESTLPISQREQVLSNHPHITRHINKPLFPHFPSCVALSYSLKNDRRKPSCLEFHPLKKKSIKSSTTVSRGCPTRGVFQSYRSRKKSLGA